MFRKDLFMSTNNRRPSAGNAPSGQAKVKRRKSDAAEAAMSNHKSSGPKSRPDRQDAVRTKAGTAKRPEAAKRSKAAKRPEAGGKTRAVKSAPSSSRTKNLKRNEKTRQKKSWSVVKKVMVAVIAVFVALITAAIGVMASKYQKIEKVTLNADELNISEDIQIDETGYLNVALFGLDTRNEDPEMGSRSDTIMIASLNRETKEVKLCSVFRDTLLEQSDGTFFKANSAYSFGGPQAAVAMLNKNLDMNIQHYITVDFSALVDVIDALGGVDIDVKEDEIYYINGYAKEIIDNTGVDTWRIEEPGLQTLTGVQATAYARIRYVGNNDFERAERQRRVLTQIAQKAQGMNLATLNKIIDKVFPKIETNFSLTEMLAYAKHVKSYKIGESTGFPFDLSTMVYGEAGDSVVPISLQNNVTKLHRFFFGNDGYVPSSTVISISSELAYLASSGEMSELPNGSSGYGENGNSYYVPPSYDTPDYGENSTDNNYYEQGDDGGNSDDNGTLNSDDNPGDTGEGGE